MNQLIITLDSALLPVTTKNGKETWIKKLCVSVIATEQIEIKRLGLSIKHFFINKRIPFKGIRRRILLPHNSITYYFHIEALAKIYPKKKFKIWVQDSGNKIYTSSAQADFKEYIKN